MPKFIIAGLLFDIQTEDKLHASLERFCSNSYGTGIKVEFEACDFISEPEELFFVEDNMAYYKDEKHPNNLSICLFYDNSDVVFGIMQIDQQWEQATIKYVGKSADYFVMLGPFGEILLQNKIIFDQGLVIHAAAIEWRGKGVLFSAPSGTGKSTQAGLWTKYMGATVLNGDRPAVRMIDKQPIIFGTPWCGSSNQFLNEQAPLEAIVILEQALENKISLLDKKEAFQQLFPNCFLPFFNENEGYMNQALETMERIIMSTPIYLLQCRPEKEAVELVYEWIK